MHSRRLILAAPLALGTAFALALLSRANSPIVIPSAVTPAVKPKHVEIDLDKAMPLPLPTLKFELKATVFKTKDNKQGWVLKVPGGRPIATPAYANGMLYVGGGYGSHEFYAFDAETGALVWQYRTNDDGPTAAVVESGFCAFNTESCTVYVLDAKTGKLVWQEWLGDPLMSQPAIYKDKLYIAYPGGQNHANNHHNLLHSAANHQTPNVQAASAASNSASTHEHRMLCCDLKTGKHLWDKPITADVISAPILDAGKVYFSCQDGTSFCMDADKGNEIWKKADNSTSAPVIGNGKVIVSQKEMKGTNTYEKVAIMNAKGEPTIAASPLPAAYLGVAKGRWHTVAGMSSAFSSALDATVGFAGGAPEAAQMSKAQSNIAISSVAQGWAYQGSRSALRKGKAFSAQGANIKSVYDDGGKVSWTADARGRGVAQSSQQFSPPALGRENMYIASGQGHLLSIDQKDGSIKFMYATEQPIVFQPALAKGNLYVGTSNGMVLCLKTGNDDADGWTAWGGNAQHNKKD